MCEIDPDTEAEQIRPQDPGLLTLAICLLYRGFEGGQSPPGNTEYVKKAPRKLLASALSEQVPSQS